MGLPDAESYDFDHTDETIWIRTERLGDKWIDSDSTQTIGYENWASGIDQNQECAYSRQSVGFLYQVFVPNMILEIS